VAYSAKDVFAIVLARDENGVAEKHSELRRLNVSHLIVCGKQSNLDQVIHRASRGKYDAINFGVRLLPQSAQIVVLNDVDTKIVNFERGLRHFSDSNIGLVFTRVGLPSGAHSMFNRLIDAVRRRFLIAANGELMFFRREVLDRMVPMRPCKAEDTLLLFETLKLGFGVIFESECHAITSRTASSSLKNEELFKRKTVCGIYQALYLSHAPLSRKLFYAMLPFVSPILLVAGAKGWYWMKGILMGIVDFLKGDRSGHWLPTYK